MPTDATHQLIEAMFSEASAMPDPGTLSARLAKIVGDVHRKTHTTETRTIDLATLSLFATASVEMWHRSVHSFLISVSLTKVSPLWASVSGYYSSHYSVRAFAHLLGYFQLFKEKWIVQVKERDGQYICTRTSKGGKDSEHKFYWATVKDHVWFKSDLLFSKNEQDQNSDRDHRTMANYADHINHFPALRTLDEAYLKERATKIATFELSEAPIPRRESYPDIDNVQLIAYHRMVEFRERVDNALGGTHLFWGTHRQPEWCSNFLDFQRIKPQFVSAPMEQS